MLGKTEIGTTTGFENEVGTYDEWNGLVTVGAEMVEISCSGTVDGISVYGIKTLVVDGKTNTQCETGASDPGIKAADVGNWLEGGSCHVGLKLSVLAAV